MSIDIKTDDEIQIMQEGGKILTDVLDATLAQVDSGVTLLELDAFAESEITKRGAKPSFQMVPGYKWTLCTCINDVVVHGIPTDYALKSGDVVGIDCGVYFKGFHTDASWTIYLSDERNKKTETEIFLSIGRIALHKGIGQVKTGNFIYDISKAIQDTVEGAGYSVVRTLIGHGVGRRLHEDPEVPGFVKKDRMYTPQIIKGMTMAIEVIYNMGGADVSYKTRDGWTIATKDGTLSGLFEATVAVTHHGCIVLTPTSLVSNKV